MRLAVNAFFDGTVMYPDPRGARNAWDDVTAVGRAVHIVVPDGSYAANRNLGLSQFQKNAAAGQVVLGYVPTRDPATNARWTDNRILNELQVAQPCKPFYPSVANWQQAYPNEIQGIYLDQAILPACQLPPTESVADCVQVLQDASASFQERTR